MKRFVACLIFSALINFGNIDGCTSKEWKQWKQWKEFRIASTSHDQENEYAKTNITPENIFEIIKSDIKFENLCRIDFVEDFINRASFDEDELSGKIISGNKNLKSLTFCRDYPKIYGFFNETAMLCSVEKSIAFCSDFSVRSNRRFICTYNSKLSLENMINEISRESFFNFPEEIKLKNSEIILKLNEIEEDSLSGSFRFFYRTETEGLYAVSVIRYDGEKVTNYIAAEQEKNFRLFNRGEFEKKLFEKIKMRNGYIEFLLSKDDTRLSNPDITFEECLKIFLEEEFLL